MVSLLAKVTNFVGVGKSLFFNAKNQIGDLVIDGTHLQDVTLSNTITEHSCEDGRYVADNIYINSLRLKMDCSIVDNPTDVIGSVREIGSLFNGNIANNLKNKFMGVSTKQKAAYQFLEDLCNSKQTVTVVSKLAIYPNMAVESVSIPITSQTGNRLQFSINLKQMRYARVEKIATLSRRYNTDGLKNLGKQSNKEATPEQQKKAASAIGNITGYKR